MLRLLAVTYRWCCIWGSLGRVYAHTPWSNREVLLGPQNIAARTFVQRANYFPIIPHPSMCQRQPAWKFPEMFALIIGVMGGPHFWESGSPGIFFRLGTQAALPRLRPVLARFGSTWGHGQGYYCYGWPRMGWFCFQLGLLGRIARKITQYVNNNRLRVPPLKSVLSDSKSSSSLKFNPGQYVDVRTYLATHTAGRIWKPDHVHYQIPGTR